MGALKGAVTAGPYKDWIEVNTYSWSFTIPVQTTSGQTGNRQPSGRVNNGDLHITKRLDDTTVDFMLQALQGKNTPTSTLVVTSSASETGADKYIEYVMENVICSSFTTSASSESGQPEESISLNFTKMGFNQFLKDAAGTERTARGAYDFTKMEKGLA
ncbi:MAG: type VI secretion system tube protein Hcp [Caulobacteraceae bacterium]